MNNMNFIVGPVKMRGLLEGHKGLLEGHNSNAEALSVYNIKPLDTFRKNELLKLKRLNDHLKSTREIPLSQNFAGCLWWAELLAVAK